MNSNSCTTDDTIIVTSLQLSVQISDGKTYCKLYSWSMHTVVIHDSSILLSLSLCVFSFLAVVSSPFSCPCTCSVQVDSICENTKNKTYMSTNPKEESKIDNAECCQQHKYTALKTERIQHKALVMSLRENVTMGKKFGPLSHYSMTEV